MVWLEGVTAIASYKSLIDMEEAQFGLQHR